MHTGIQWPWRWGMPVVFAVLMLAGEIEAQSPGWQYGLRRSKPTYGPGSSRSFHRQPWVKTALRRHPDQLYGVRFAEAVPRRSPGTPIGSPAPEAIEIQTGPTRPALPWDETALASVFPAALGSLRRIPREPDPDAGADGSHAVLRAWYANSDGNRAITISIHDLTGDLPDTSRQDIARALATNFDTETAEGYDRTGDIQGYRAMMHWRHQPQVGEISLMVGPRVGLHVQGQGVPMSTLVSSLDRLDLPALADVGL